jgi:hypothetical protein
LLYLSVIEDVRVPVSNKLHYLPGDIGIYHHLSIVGYKIAMNSELDHKLKKIIQEDDKATLEELMIRMSLPPTSQLFEECAGKLAQNCFAYLFSIRDADTVKQDNQFLKLCVDQAKKGCNYDGRTLWCNSHKRNAPTPPPAKYSLPWDFSIRENVFVLALNEGTRIGDMKKAMNFVKMLIMMRVPCGDNLYFTINSIDSIQGYVSLFHKYIYQDHFTTYASKARQNQRGG